MVKVKSFLKKFIHYNITFKDEIRKTIYDNPVNKVTFKFFTFFSITLFVLLFLSFVDLTELLKKLYIVQILGITCILSFILVLSLIQFASISMAILCNLGLVSFILTVSTSTKWFEGQNKVGVFMLITSYVIFLFNIIIIAYKVSKKEQPNKPKTIILRNNWNNGEKVAKLKTAKWMGIAIYKVDNFLYKIDIIIIPVLYIELMLIIVFFFALIYEQYNIFNGGMEGLFYSWLLPDKKVMVHGWDILYYSSTTFFTVGYGDIIPIGEKIKFIAQLEMIVGHILSVIYIPILIYFLIIKFNRLQSKEYKKNTDKKTTHYRSKRFFN